MVPGNKYNLEYISRINRAIDYIQKNIDRDLTLELVAKKANFSAFHFHRIFKSIVGEPLYAFIKRIRLEKAAFFLIHNEDLSITEIALKSGFLSSQSFAKAFKSSFKVTPSVFRKKSKNRHTNSKNGKDFICDYEYDFTESRPQIIFKSLTPNNMDVKIKEIPEMSVAYVRHIGPYKGQDKVFTDIFCKLCGWAGPKGLINKEAQFLSVYYDDPNITEESKLRVDVCLTVAPETEVKGEIGKQTLASGKYAVARFELKGPEAYEGAWNAVYKDWLPNSGFQPDDRPAYEVYQNDPKDHPECIHIVDICVPVKEL